MFTALTMAGYTWKTVDTFRKAIGKKNSCRNGKNNIKFLLMVV